MGKNESRAYLKAMRSRYRRAGKKTKVRILDKFCAVCDYHRKYAIRLLNQPVKTGKKRRTGPKPIYASAELLTALKRVWFASDQMCSKKLKAAMTDIFTTWTENHAIWNKGAEGVRDQAENIDASLAFDMQGG